MAAPSSTPPDRPQGRIGSFEDQRRSTWEKLGVAIVAHDREAALELAEFALGGECRFIFDLLTGWADDSSPVARRAWGPDEELRPPTDRLAQLLAFRDGEPYDPGVGWGGGRPRRCGGLPTC